MNKLIEDLDHYSFRLGLPKFFALFTPFIYLTTWPIICYRFQYWIWTAVKIPVLRQFLMLIGFMMKYIVVIATGVTISHQTKIGKGFFISHIGSIVIGNGSEIGDYCSIHQGVTIGGAGIGENYGKPTIGNNVFIGPGAVIIGKIIIGDNIAIGANAVVTKDFPNNITIGGVPAKIISRKGSNGMIHYRKKSSI